MKILFSSDWHLDAVTAGFERYDDVEAAVAETVDVAMQERVAAYVFCGDLCDPNTSRSYRAISAAVRAAGELEEAGIPSMWLTGNHDVIEDGHGTSTLEPLIDMVGPRVVSSPEFIELAGGCSIAMLPYTPRSHTYDPEKVVEQLDDGDPPHVVVGHLCIEGIHPGSETTHMPRGRDVYFPYDAIRKRWPKALLVNGHYHEAQEWRGRSGRNRQAIHVPGSLARLTFGEQDLTPGYMIAEVQGG